MATMGSAPSDLFQVSSVNGGRPLFEVSNLEVIGNKWPHMSFESYQSYQKKGDEQPPEMRILKYSTPENLEKHGRPNLYKSRSTACVYDDWKKFEEVVDTPKVPMRTIAAYRDDPFVLRVKPALDGLMIPRAAVSKFFLLGIGSLHDEKFGKIAVQQCLLALRVITIHFNLLLNSLLGSGKDIGEHYQPEILFDSTSLNRDDIGFLWKKFEWDFCKLSYAPLSHILTVINSPHAFIITFQPDNPVRQMLADIVLHDPKGNVLPAIICAPWEHTNTSRDGAGDIFAADKTSDRVGMWLQSYHTTAFKEPQEDSPFGEVVLHVHDSILPQPVETNTPAGNTPFVSVGNSPEPSTTPMYDIAPSVGNVPTSNPPESRQSGQAQSPAVALLQLPQEQEFYSSRLNKRHH